MQKIKIASAKSVKGINQYENQLITFTDLVERLEEPKRTDESMAEYIEWGNGKTKEERRIGKDNQTTAKDAAGAFVGGWLEVELEDTQLHRSKENLLYRSILTLDYDNGSKEFLAELINQLKEEDYSYILYSTHSHTPDDPAFRVLIPLSRTIGEVEHEAVARAVVKTQDSKFDAVDTASFEYAQAMFYATVSNDAEYIFEHEAKEPLDVDKILSEYKTTDYEKRYNEWHMRTPSELARGIREKSRGTGKLTDPKERAGYVGAFNRAYNIHEAIEKFIPEVYEETRDADKYTYAEGSQAGGAHVHNDYGEGTFLWSYHDTDPANNRKNNHSYDLVRIHKFGGLDKNSDAEFIDLPSQKEMQALAMGDDKTVSEYKKNEPKYDMTNLALEQATEEVEQTPEQFEEAKAEYLSKNNAGRNVGAFKDGVSESANTPAIPTGFPELDKLIDDGLYAGLYSIGAISSLGKTTLMMQIADQIARTGQDVLIFSLEMSRHEIMAKSISRITYEKSKNAKLAKSLRDITAGARYKDYSDKERELIEASVGEYGTYADNVYIVEGLGDIRAEDITKYVEKHIEYTGNRPAVFVDYLQIVQPHNDRVSDKQKVDKVVLDLKIISRECKVPVVVVSSFNRSSYKVPVTMEAFKESGSIEYSSDVVIGLQFAAQGIYYRDSKSPKAKQVEVLKDGSSYVIDIDHYKSVFPRDIEFKILKNRNGITGESTYFKYDPRFNYFEESSEPTVSELEAQRKGTSGGAEPKYNFGNNFNKPTQKKEKAKPWETITVSERVKEVTDK